MIINNFCQIHKITDHDIFKLLKQMEPSLNIDVGGFVGEYAIKLSQNKHRVISYEPFKDNLKFFKENTKNNKLITLVDKAVSDENGEGGIAGANKIKKNNNNWSDKYKGGSAVGWLDKNYKNNIVKTCRLSDEIKEKVLLLKIDIQGGEYKCLLGAEQLIDNYGIDIMIIEFTGNKNILNFLEKKNYMVFDLEYIQWNIRTNESIYNYKKIIPEKNYILSNGLPARRIFYTDRPSDITNYNQFLNNFPNKDFDGQQTDLLCIHKSAYDKIFPLLEKYSKEKNSIFIKIKNYFLNYKYIIFIIFILIIIYLWKRKRSLIL
jgi:FkbM family methyltransferase